MPLPARAVAMLAAALRGLARRCPPRGAAAPGVVGQARAAGGSAAETRRKSAGGGRRATAGGEGSPPGESSVVLLVKPRGGLLRWQRVGSVTRPRQPFASILFPSPPYRWGMPKLGYLGWKGLLGSPSHWMTC